MNKERDKNGYYVGVINPYNGHNRELVDKICDAWDNPKYHDRFGDILYALLMRDKDEYLDKFICNEGMTKEYAMAHAHDIMENICDDLDLECILKFIRYE